MGQTADLSHVWGQDLDVTPSGDIAIVTGSQRTIQRIIRRLMTAATALVMSDYPWEPGYGAGLGARIGQTFDARGIQAVVLSQMLQEESVAPIPAPTVSVTANGPFMATIDVTYTDTSGTSQSFSFDLNPPE